MMEYFISSRLMIVPVLLAVSIIDPWIIFLGTSHLVGSAFSTVITG